MLETNDSKQTEEIIAMKKRVAQMEDTMDNYEQYSKLDNLIITGLKCYVLIMPISFTSKRK